LAHKATNTALLHVYMRTLQFYFIFSFFFSLFSVFLILFYTQGFPIIGYFLFLLKKDKQADFILLNLQVSTRLTPRGLSKRAQFRSTGFQSLDSLISFGPPSMRGFIRLFEHEDNYFAYSPTTPSIKRTIWIPTKACRRLNSYCGGFTFE